MWVGKLTSGKRRKVVNNWVGIDPVPNSYSLDAINRTAVGLITNIIVPTLRKLVIHFLLN